MNNVDVPDPGRMERAIRAAAERERFGHIRLYSPRPGLTARSL
ncbi:hypothetical protein AB4Z29_18205 [Paenibacillus sp. 2TAB23]